ncbi:hypothetical protein EK904_014476, partial [Melospiza melodia maxima]
MNEVVETLRKIEEKYKLFQQQQFTFIRALERTREEAHDMMRPVSSIVQVQCYKDNHCYNATDRRILNMYPHGVVNHLSLEEAQHRYGGVVSLLPIVLDSMRDWVTHSNLKVLYI